MRHPWARLWYWCRGIDQAGSGLTNISWQETKTALGCAGSTLYQWLRSARAAGAIYEYSRRGDRLRIRLGGLFNVCRSLELDDWGAVAMLPIKRVLDNCRELATAIATQQLQGQSRHAVQKSLSNSERKVFRLPSALDVIREGKTASLKPMRGATNIPFLIHVGAKRAFVSQGFIPFGASQGAIASELAISDRTVRRHHLKLEVESRQLCQSKHDYLMIDAAIRSEAPKYVAESGIWCQRQGNEIILHERNGATHRWKKGGHRLPLTGNRLKSECDRFFTYFGKTWLYRCSLYGLSHHLQKMRVARSRYKKYRSSDKSSL